MGLIALNFKYIGYKKAETFRFYRRILRGFLRWHRTKAVWLKGVGKKKAYLLLVDYLKKNALRMFLDALSYGGYFQAEALDPITVLRENEENFHETVGYLSYGGIQVGNPDDMHCPMEGYRKVSVNGYCIGDSDSGQKPCPFWNQYRCTYPKKWRG